MNARFASILTQLDLTGLPPRSLTIGCGTFPEFESLINRWPAWMHIGLDHDISALRHALRQSHRICADGRRLPFAADFSLIVIRHPNIAEARAAWGEIFADVRRHLVEDGLLLVTTYDLDEFAFARARVSVTPKNILLDESSLTPTNLAGYDRYILACRR